MKRVNAQALECFKFRRLGKKRIACLHVQKMQMSIFTFRNTKKGENYYFFFVSSQT